MLAFAAKRPATDAAQNAELRAQLAALPPATNADSAWPAIELDELVHGIVVESDLAHVPLIAALRPPRASADTPAAGLGTARNARGTLTFVQTTPLPKDDLRTLLIDSDGPFDLSSVVPSARRRRALIVREFLRAVGTTLRRKLAEAKRHREARRAYGALCELDERMLRDLGFSPQRAHVRRSRDRTASPNPPAWHDP